MLKHFNRIFLYKKWVILVFCTALGNIFCVHGVQKLKFTVEPSDVVTIPGRPVILNCAVQIPDDYTQEVDIRWRGDDPSSYFHDRDPRRNLLSNGSLFIPHAALEDQGNYQCVAVFNSIGSMASRFAKVQVAGPPSLANQPQDLRVFPGQTAHFSCMMSGPLKYSITWLKDEKPLINDTSKMVLMPSGSLEIDKVDSSDQGSYKCNASSSGVYKISNKAVLTMDMDVEAASNVMAPVFITQPKSMVVQEGDTITLDCAANGYPRPWLIWLKQGVTLDITDVGSRFKKLGTGSLQISNIEEKDAGSYQCRAENAEDSNDATATIEVQVPPRFIRKPESITAFEKEDIELTCQVTGKPEPKVQWLKNGEAIKTNDYLKLVDGYNLKILGLMEMDAGIFQCFASNAVGNIQAAAHLTVLQLRPTNLDSKKQNLNLGRDRLTPSLLKCDDDETDSDNKDDDYDMTNPLLLNISLPTLSKDSKISYNPNKLPPQFFSSKNLGSSDLGKEETYSAYLPSKPRDLEAKVVSKTYVTLSWKPPLEPNGELKSYSIFFRQEGSQRERVLNVSEAFTEDQTVLGLQPNRLYHFRVVANNNNGPGRSSDDFTVVTEAEVNVPGPPVGINAFATSPTSIYVQWKPPGITNEDNLQYNLYYMERDSVDERSIKTSDLAYELNGLKKFTEYSIWVDAYNENGSAGPSDDILVRTLSDTPSEPPQNVSIEVFSATSIIVRWEPPPKDGQNGVITGYKLRYKKQSRRNRGDRGNTVTAAGDRRLHVLSDLDKGSTYQIRLWAMNNNGTGPPTDWYTVETYDNDLDETQVPDQPTNLIARPSASSIRVSWGPPKNSNILVRGYTIRWGKGAPYDRTKVLEGKQRSLNIEDLENDSEYVISLSAYNRVGAGQAVYVSVRTREELESQAPLMPPVGLKAIVLSATSVVLSWTDTLRNPPITDDRYYSVRYSSAHHPNPRPKYYNTTDLNCMITDLRPNTQYEFSVKLIKGRRESKWSMIVFNTTLEDVPSSPPRDLTIVPVEKNPTQVNLNWQPPKQANGLITGYIILYTTDAEKSEKDWVTQNIVGDKMTAVIKGLKPSTTYYFKIQARNSKGHGPLSLRVSFTTGEGSTLSHESNLFGKDGRPLSRMIYIILACSLIAVFCVTLIIGIICCKRASVRHHNTSGYMKGNLKPNTNIKPPDLWIHHDQMELKALEKSHHSNSDIGPSSSGSQMNTLGRNSSQQNDFENSGSLDKRTYLPSYVGINTNAEKTSTIKRTVKPKPISLPLDSQPIAQPVMTTSSNVTQSPGSELGRPLYPRTQYRAHITLDSSGNAIENPYSLQSAYDSIGNVAPSVIISASGTYSNTASGTMANQNTSSSQAASQQTSASAGGENNGTLGKRQQGHPLKSFSVPAPPPQSAPSTPQQKHIVRPIQGSSPYKKPGPHGIIGTGSPSNTKLRTGPGTAEESARLQPSYSTEELNQEMANLEGLMKDLNAITASEFEC